ncbi:hypothetical protein [Mycobacterium gallinarum]|nr:hypothetical protein [Mycobacterium gallinarum]
MVAAILTGALGGCGSPSDPAATPASDSSSSSSTKSPATSTPPSAAAVDGTIVDIDIAGGIVTPTNGQAQGTVGKPIVLKVDSDVSDSLHVHAVPEHTFQVEPRPGQQFEFTVDVPGQVDIELHDLNRTVVTIQVRP